MQFWQGRCILCGIFVLAHNKGSAFAILWYGLAKIGTRPPLYHHSYAWWISPIQRTLPDHSFSELCAGLKGALSRYSVIFAPFVVGKNNGSHAFFQTKHEQQKSCLRLTVALYGAAKSKQLHLKTKKARLERSSDQDSWRSIHGAL